MKIPQRQDQVSLTSQQVATGQAVEPVAEAMGSSYVDTMKSMNKTFQELSDLSYKLYENKMEGQQDKLKLYANQRTKQYEQEISMATNQEELDKLFFQYKKDIDTAGNELLGAERYNSWYSKEGGATVAGAEYAGNVASAQLQINLNKQTLEDAGRQYNELAFTARNPEERNKYIKEWEDMLNRYVANGTISQAEKQKNHRDWNLSFTKSLVAQDADINPEKTLKNLRENKDYAPMLIGAERLQYIAEAERLIATRKGTMRNAANKLFSEVWTKWNYSNQGETFDVLDDKGKVVKDANGEPVKKSYYQHSLDVYNVFVNNPIKAKALMSKMTGIDEKDIDMEDVASMREYMRKNIVNGDRVINDSYTEDFSSYAETTNNLLTYKTINSKKEEEDVVAKGSDIINKFKNKELKNLHSTEQVIQVLQQKTKLTSDPAKRALFYDSVKDKLEILQRDNDFTDIYLENLKEKQLDANSLWEKNMQELVKEVQEVVNDAGLVNGKDREIMRNIVQGLAVYNPQQMFNKFTKLTEQEKASIMEVVVSSIPTHYKGLRYEVFNVFSDFGDVEKVEKYNRKKLDDAIGNKGLSHLYLESSKYPFFKY
jgi:hypothetical protein